ncbi:MAG: hypothetical protein RPU72_15250 [Candidatus Sedimenticola sp. (ex Thyasira tokunagai)]
MKCNNYIVEVNDRSDIKFTGYLLAKASTSDNTASGGIYSGETGRWTELELYKTKEGYYVCNNIYKTLWDGERDINNAVVCTTQEQVIDFFGFDALAKSLYSDADIDCSTKVI